MSRLLLSALMILSCAAAVEARQSTLALGCAEAAALVAANGAVVLSTGAHTYDRFVASPNICLPGEWGDQAYVPTRDGTCRIGYTCQPGPAPWEEVFDRF